MLRDTMFPQKFLDNIFKPYKSFDEQVDSILLFSINDGRLCLAQKFFAP